MRSFEKLLNSRENLKAAEDYGDLVTRLQDVVSEEYEKTLLVPIRNYIDFNIDTYGGDVKINGELVGLEFNLGEMWADNVREISKVNGISYAEANKYLEDRDKNINAGGWKNLGKSLGYICGAVGSSLLAEGLSPFFKKKSSYFTNLSQHCLLQSDFLSEHRRHKKVMEVLDEEEIRLRESGLRLRGKTDASQAKISDSLWARGFDSKAADHYALNPNELVYNILDNLKVKYELQL